ncbi:MAG: VanZ family protein [Ignavibacteriaceae bacterium]|nr:VanZ family protein [Ignavibacteriaceae bacterium]
MVVLSSLPQSTGIKSNGVDKYYHLGAYAFLSFIVFFTLTFQARISLFKRYSASFTLLLTTIFGMLNELYQLFIPSRSFNKLDLLANILGSLLMVIVIKFSLIIIRLVKV